MSKPTQNSLISLSKSAQTWLRQSREEIRRPKKTMKRARWVAITRPPYKQHSPRASKRRCGVRKSQEIYIRRRVEGSTRTRSWGLACRFPASLHLMTSSDSDTYSQCITMEPCVVVTLKVNAVLALSRIMNNADRTKKILREAGLLKANLRVTYGVTAIKTSWTPLNTTIWTTESVQATRKAGVVGVTLVEITTTATIESVEIEVVIELRLALTERIKQNIEQIIF